MNKKNKHLDKRRHVLVSTKKIKPLLVDRLTYAAAIVEPIVTVPQVVVIFRDQTAAGISLFSWAGYQAMTLIWIWYAIVHKDKLILMYQSLFFIVQTAVIVGGIIYGAHWL